MILTPDIYSPLKAYHGRPSTGIFLPNSELKNIAYVCPAISEKGGVIIFSLSSFE
jgi:hypothetical protein